MKKLLVLAMLMAAFFGKLGTGCTTTPEGNTTVNTNTINQISVVFRSASRVSALMVIADDPASKQWFELASTVIGQLVAGAKHDPAAFKAALKKLPPLNDKWLVFVVGNLVDSYELYYLNYAAPINDKTTSGWVAAKLLTAVQEGFDDAIAGRSAASGKVMSGGKLMTLDQAKAWLKAKVARK
jgi:hypothetical protein